VGVHAACYCSVDRAFWADI